MAKYLDNKKLQRELELYQQSVRKAKAEDRQPPIANDYIGKCIYDIAHRFATRRNFFGYTNLWKEEMIADGIENCIRYGLMGYNTEKYNNPLNYFTKIIQQSFVRRIEREKKEQVKKLKSRFDNEQLVALHDNAYMIQDNEIANQLIKDYEAKVQKSKNKRNAKKGVELFIE